MANTTDKLVTLSLLSYFKTKMDTSVDEKIAAIADTTSIDVSSIEELFKEKGNE